MTQSRKRSALEAATQVAIGLAISVLAGFVIYPLCDVPMTFAKNINVTICYTLLSFLRTYIVRRWFNREAA